MLNKESDEESYLDDSDNERLSGEEIFTKKKKGKKGRKGQWPEHFVDDLVDVILDDETLKEKLLLTNVKNKKNGQYCGKVIELISLRCKERNEEFSFSVAQTRQKFKRCINICRDAVMKVKTSSGIKRFQEEKDLGNWFGKLLPIISSMDNCQPEQALEPGCISPDAPEPSDPTEDLLNHESENHARPSSTSSTSSKDSNQKASNGKRKYVSTPSSGKKPRAQTDALLNEMKETMNSLKILASDTSSREILNLLNKDSQRQAARDDAFLQLMGALVTQSNPNVVSPMTYPMQDTHSQYRYGMTNSRPNAQEFNVCQNQNNFSFLQQLNNQDLP